MNQIFFLYNSQIINFKINRSVQKNDILLAHIKLYRVSLSKSWSTKFHQIIG